MAEIERPERITNITGLRAQSESPADSASGEGAGPYRWPRAHCRLCRRPVWLFARGCVCGMTDPARDARRPYTAPAAAVLAVALAGLAWWWTRG